MDGVLLLKTVEFSRCQGLSWNSTYVRPAGGPNRGMLYAAAALQWRIDRLSACLGRRRWSRAADRYSAARRDRIGLRYRRLYRLLRCGQHYRDGPIARLHQPRHFAGARLDRRQWGSLKLSFGFVLAPLDNKRGAV